MCSSYSQRRVRTAACEKHFSRHSIVGQTIGICAVAGPEWHEKIFRSKLAALVHNEKGKSRRVICGQSDLEIFAGLNQARQCGKVEWPTERKSVERKVTEEVPGEVLGRACSNRDEVRRSVGAALSGPARMGVVLPERTPASTRAAWR